MTRFAPATLYQRRASDGRWPLKFQGPPRGDVQACFEEMCVSDETGEARAINSLLKNLVFLVLGSEIQVIAAL
jgi:hypothetical protein